MVHNAFTLLSNKLMFTLINKVFKNGKKKRWATKYIMQTKRYHLPKVVEIISIYKKRKYIVIALLLTLVMIKIEIYISTGCYLLLCRSTTGSLYLYFYQYIYQMLIHWALTIKSYNLFTWWEDSSTNFLLKLMNENYKWRIHDCTQCQDKLKIFSVLCKTLIEKTVLNINCGEWGTLKFYIKYVLYNSFRNL